MPALNIIAIHDTVLNSGFSPSLPRVMSPKRPTASQITNTTKAVATSTNSQPIVCIVQPSALSEALPRDSVSMKPQARKPIARAAVTPNTTLSRRPETSCSSIGFSSAGCSPSSYALGESFGSGVVPSAGRVVVAMDTPLP